MPPGAPQPVWNFSRAADGLKLALGEPATDNVRLMLRCEGEGRVRVSYSASEGGAGEQMTLVSGGAQSTLATQVITPEAYGSAIVAAQTSLDDPALAGFRNTGRLSVRRAGQPIDADAEPSEMDQVRAFFEACGRQQ